MIQKEQPKCQFRVGHLVRLRLNHPNAPSYTLSGSDHGIVAGDICKITSVESCPGGTASGLRVYVINGYKGGYCADWFEQCAEDNVIRLLKRVDGK